MNIVLTVVKQHMEKSSFLYQHKNFTIHATFYYTLTTMQHYEDDTMRSKRQCPMANTRRYIVK